jgi:aminotransferase
MKKTIVKVLQVKWRNEMITVFGSLVGEKEIENVVTCMKSQWMGFGGNVSKFEENFSTKFNVPHFAMVDSGSNALFMAVSLLDLPPGSEIIVPSFTWVSCAQAVLLAGHKPVFCDVDLKTMNIRREDIEKCLTPNVKAIMIVHYAGLAVDLDPIMDLKLPVIEDAAHAVCSTYKGKPCGAIADVGIYSFDAVKNLTTGEGGGIASTNPSFIERAKVMRYCGIGKSGFEAAVSNAKGKDRWWEYNIQQPFIKMLPTNIAAGIGMAQLDTIDKLQNTRKKIWQYYQSEFARFSWITTPVEAPKEETHSYFTYCIRVPKRDQLARFLLDNGVYTTLRYHPLHMNPLYKQLDRKLPNCELLNEDCLSIPIHPRLTDKEAEIIVTLIKDFGNKNSL